VTCYRATYTHATNTGSIRWLRIVRVGPVLAPKSPSNHHARRKGFLISRFFNRCARFGRAKVGIQLLLARVTGTLVMQSSSGREWGMRTGVHGIESWPKRPETMPRSREQTTSG